jgi:hypothetical protein
MPILPKRALRWAFFIGVVLAAITGFTSESAAQVFQGPLDFDDLPVLTMTVTLHPGGPASYTIATLQGRVIDVGFLGASVNGSSVSGFFQSTRFPVRACEFRGSLNGPVATLTLDALSCGGGGTLTLTQIS